MSQVQVRAERIIAATAAVVYQCLADYRQHHSNFLPPAFSDFVVEEGGVGAGTVIRYTVTAGGRPRADRDLISELEPGRVLVETDESARKVTTFTLEPDGDQSLVRVETTFPAAAGLAGIIKRWLAPCLLRSIYRDELERLNRHAISLPNPDAAE
jgi:hypothetical protein